MKKILSILAASFALAAPLFAQSQPTAQFRYVPLLTGFNVVVPTNATIGIGSTNVEYTDPKGTILYSLTNTYATLGNDAFAIAELKPDANGDINANASLYVYVGNTNLVPFASVSNSTSLPFNVTATNWLLGFNTGGSVNRYNVGTNLYPNYISNATNVLTVTLYRSPFLTLNGVVSPLWETNSAFVTNIVTAAGTSASSQIVLLPASWLQGARFVKATVTATPLINASQSLLLNTMGILQPQP